MLKAQKPPTQQPAIPAPAVPAAFPPSAELGDLLTLRGTEQEAIDRRRVEKTRQSANR